MEISRTADPTARGAGQESVCELPVERGQMEFEMGAIQRATVPVTVTEDVRAFVREHGDHGQLVGDAALPVAHGYMIEVAGPCGVTFACWVAPMLAAEDLAAPGAFQLLASTRTLTIATGIANV